MARETESLGRPLLLGWGALGLALCLSACAVSSHAAGRPIPQDKIDRIVKGKTTTDQVIEWFGAPTSQTEMGGNILYTYIYTVNRGSGFTLGYFTSASGKSETDELTITFDKATGRVKTFSIQRGIE